MNEKRSNYGASNTDQQDIPEYAGVILLTAENHIILQLRDNKPNIADPNKLSIFAGRLEPNETPEAGALREIYEETDLQPESLEFFTTYQTDIERYGRIAKSHIFIARNIDPQKIKIKEGQGYRIIKEKKRPRKE